MAYTTKNFKTKKAVKEAIKNGEQVTVFQPGLGTVPDNGEVFLEGPHFPAAHTWYGKGQMENGLLVKIA